MNAHTANRINALVLIICGLWAYLTPQYSFWTALIPTGFGVALLLCSPGVKVENKVIAHVAVLLTLIIFGLLFVPLVGAVQEGSVMSILRVVVMLCTCVVAMVAFIKSFRDARRRREA